jgi:Toxin co-regulated pilus biosynthesis protein Q
MNHWALFFRQAMAMVCAMCFLSIAHAQDDAGLDSLQQLVTQWKEGIATGDVNVSMLLPLYVRADQDKVAKVFPYVKTGQATLPFAAEMLDGRWFMRGDDIQWPDLALAVPATPQLMRTPEPEPTPAPMPMPMPTPTSQLTPTQPMHIQPAIARPATPPVVPVQVQANLAPDQPVSVVPQLPTYAVSLADQNFRKVLTRWANASGWMFEPEHWSVTRDIPVGGADSVMTDFKTAVRRLLKSTLLTDLPVQPCFYSNKVLRVIPASELCSRTEH